MIHGLPALLRAYGVATAAFEPAIVGFLHLRQRRGREERARLGERQGRPGRARPAGHLVWVHGASIGETMSLLPIIERLAQRGIAVLVTSGTRTSASLLARRLPPGAFHQFVPVDVPRYLRRFLDHWRPDLILLAESEIWPNTVIEAHRRAIPLILLNGRMSDRSFRRWEHFPAAIRALLERFSLCLAQSHDDAERFARLGAPQVTVAGNLKFDAPPPPADPRVVAQLSGLMAGRPVWLAASTHSGEEEMLLAVHRTIAERHPDLLTLVVPRHPQRGPELADLASRLGLRTALRSDGANPDSSTEVYVADTIGELGLFYRLTTLVFVGGSLVPHGGQNPIEPVKLGAAVLHGPHVHNFRDIYAALDGASASIEVLDEEALIESLDRLLGDPARMRRMARAGTETIQELGGAVDRTLQTIEPFIAQMKLAERR
nr:3-deoxy-D-manno-octulosonic acid transferase [Microvirga massiliensis]